MLAAAPSLTGIERLRRAVRIASGLSGAALVAFHGWLLASQFADGRLAEPGSGAAVGDRRRARRRSGRAVSLAADRIWSRKGSPSGCSRRCCTAPRSPPRRRLIGVLSLPEAVATVVLQIAATAGIARARSLDSGLAARRDRSAVQPSGSHRRMPALRRRHASGRRPFSPRPPPRPRAIAGRLRQPALQSRHKAQGQGDTRSRLAFCLCRSALCL